MDSSSIKTSGEKQNEESLGKVAEMASIFARKMGVGLFVLVALWFEPPQISASSRLFL